MYFTIRFQIPRAYRDQYDGKRVGITTLTAPNILELHTVISDHPEIDLAWLIKCGYDGEAPLFHAKSIHNAIPLF